MRCAFCGTADTRVIDTRIAEDGSMIRRRRECPSCGARFTTQETVELKPPMIIKRDGRREPFNEAKIRGGVERAFEKRKVGINEIDGIIERVGRKLRQSGEREVPARQLGAWLMEELKSIDQVAYVRFASVYRRFEDVQAFREEIEQLERDIPKELVDRQFKLLSD